MTTTINTSIIRGLRSLTPARPLNVTDARQIAELQANHLRRRTGDHSPHFDTDAIERLPKIKVIRSANPKDFGSKHSGFTQYRYDTKAWRIKIRSDEALVRQRFTLCHEFKHVLDIPLRHFACAGIAHRIDSKRQVEAICNHFAATLLMPKAWVGRLWGEGTQDLQALAYTFDVSRMAMRIRLTSLGLIDRSARPVQQRNNGASPSKMAYIGRRKYYRKRPTLALSGGTL